MKTKLLYITNQICGPGGLERVLSIKASYLADNMGYEVHIITFNQGERPLFYEFSDNLFYHDIDAVGNLLKYFYSYRNGIQKIIDDVTPDIISVCDDGVKGLFVPLWFGKSIPIVYERHTTKWAYLNKNKGGMVNHIKFQMINFLLDYGSSLYDYFVVLTMQNGREWPRAKVKVLPNPSSIYPEESAVLKNKRVLSVGKRTHTKGFDLLIHSWSKIVEFHPDWELVIIGEEVSSNDLQGLIDELHLNENIFMYPPTMDIEEEYKKASIYVLSSRYEGFGMVLVEAMACGVPCVSFDCPCGPAEIISHEEDGFLVPAEKVNALAKKVTLLIENKDLRKKMGAKARINAARYIPDAIVPQWDVLFNELLDDKFNEVS